MIEKKCHFIGIGGIGMSALAKILLEKDWQVSGSDLSQNSLTESLSQKGADIFIGHSEHHVSKYSTVIFSSDIPKKNPEYQKASDLECNIIHRSDLLTFLMKDQKALAITGTHGKTSTTSLLAYTLYHALLDPSFAIGGIATNFKTNGKHGKGEYFVVEADESDGTFLKYNPFGAIITNIDYDHMNHFKTEENLLSSFKSFFNHVSSKNHLFFCGDDEKLLKINQESDVKGVAYGFLPDNDLRGSHFSQKGWSTYFTVDFQGKTYSDIELNLLGKHNATNALAVFGLCISLGVEENRIREAFKTFEGVSRRAEKKAFIQGCLLLDDYAHHPAEIKATLKGIKKAVEAKRLIAVYQPHRYSRTKDILGTFKDCFEEADELILTDIYGAGEEEIEGLSHENILFELKDLKIPFSYIPRKNLAEELKQQLFPHDVVVSLGAGDITKLSDEILEIHKKEPINKIKIGIVFGGKSKEHEISLKSARHVVSALNPDFYEPYLFAVSKTGVWEFGESYLNTEAFNCQDKNALSKDVLDKIQECGILFPILHGPFGEDGTIQGLFEMLAKPYVGCNHQASATCMNKILTKNLMVAHKIPTSPFIGFNAYDWKNNCEEILGNIKQILSFPLYVKPSHLGSAVGVSKVVDENKLKEAIANSFLYGRDVIVENEIKGREIEFAVIGNDEIEVFPPGEIFINGEVYTYEAKYIADTKTSAKAALPEDLVKQGMELAKKAYKICACQGMARVDFFLDHTGKFWLNEINTIPGFTSISLYPAMCAANGLKSLDLIDKLIQLGFEKRRNGRKYEC